jgi:Fe-S-cluster-containing hydrogenase component 2
MAKSESFSKDPYAKLALTLNRIPNGFPILKDGSHLKVLKWIFTPDEAELFSRMKLRGETAQRISRRLKIPLDILIKKLDTMKKKGQIRTFITKKGKKKYGLFPFVVGIYEEQLHRMDEEFAKLFEEFAIKTQGQEIFSQNPPIQRVIPVNRSIKTELVIKTYNQAEMLVQNAKSWGVRDCICRTQQELIGNGCSYPKSICMEFSFKENAYENSKVTTPITKERAMEYLYEAEEAGLIHTTMNIANGHPYICNCCTCCCGILRGLKEFNQPLAIVKSDYKLVIDEKQCTGCKKCLDRCQFDALEIIDKKCIVNNSCIGCGVCTLVCPKDAMSLVLRDKRERKKPVKGILRWFLKRGLKRRANLLKVI